MWQVFPDCMSSAINESKFLIVYKKTVEWPVSTAIYLDLHRKCIQISDAISIKVFFWGGGGGQDKTLDWQKVKNYMQSAQKWYIFAIFLLKLSNLV